MITLVLGGEKSGKSDLALQLLGQEPGPRAFVPTGKAKDASFRARIARHRQERGADLPVLESGGADLPGLLESAGQSHGALLVDSLDFWLFSCGEAAPAVTRLLSCLDTWRGGSVVLVSCEVGLGPVAADAQTRAFVRNLGHLNREVARRARRVYLCVAGLPLTLKDLSTGPGATQTRR